MSTNAASPKIETGSHDSKNFWSVFLPYGIAILAHVPLLLLYWRQLSHRPHYSFFPFAILAVAGIAYVRWPRDQEMPFHKSIFSNILLGCGLITSLGSVLFLEPWFSAISVAFIVASFFARTIDSLTGRSLWVCALPLFTCLYLPLNYDFRLITSLQRVAALFTSRLLDLIGLGHHVAGTVIQVPGRQSYGIEQACSGVQSFFTLLFVAIVFIVLNRRPWFRATLLVLAAIFWAIFMNTVRILAIPLADYFFDGAIDLSVGAQHAALGYTVLAFGILMLFSTDQFLMFLFGPVDPTVGNTGGMSKTVMSFWNKMVAGDNTDEDAKKKRRSRRKPVSKLGFMLAWITAGVLLLGSLLQMQGIWSSLASEENLKIKYFSSEIMVPMAETDLKKEYRGEFADASQRWQWTQLAYQAEDRKRGSDLGRHSDTWVYQTSGCRAAVSMDQTFPGWHELTTCYRNQGWKLGPRHRRTHVVNINGEETTWSYIEAHFSKPTGEKGLLFFSLFDAFGDPYDAPETWGVNAFFIRAKNRLSQRVRARLSQGEGYQTQAFAARYVEFDDKLVEELREGYLLAREDMRTKFMARRRGELATVEPAAEEEDASKP